MVGILFSVVFGFLIILSMFIRGECGLGLGWGKMFWIFIFSKGKTISDLRQTILKFYWYNDKIT